MGDRNFRGPLKTLETNVRVFYGKFTGKGAAAIEGVDCLGFTIARTGVGLFTITMDDRYPTAEGATATPPLLMIKTHRKSAAAGATGELQSIVDSSAAAAKTITCRWAEAGAAADVTDTDVIFLELVFRNTSLPRKGV